MPMTYAGFTGWVAEKSDDLGISRIAFGFISAFCELMTFIFTVDMAESATHRSGIFGDPNGGNL